MGDCYLTKIYIYAIIQLVKRNLLNMKGKTMMQTQRAIQKQEAPSTILDFAELLIDRNVGMQTLLNPNADKTTVWGLQDEKDLMAIFSHNPAFFLASAHNDNLKFDSIGQYVWYAVEKHLTTILNHWAWIGAIIYFKKDGVWDKYDTYLVHQEDESE